MQGWRGLWQAIAIGSALAVTSASAQLPPAQPAADAQVAGTPRALVLGVFPRYAMTSTLTMFAPLADELTRTLGREVRLETARDFETFWHHVAQNRYDIVHYNQYHYIKAHRLLGHRAIARNEEAHESTVVSGIVVRQDSGIDALAALKGKTVMFGRGRHAMQGYIVPAYLLRKAGLRASDYDEQFARTPCDAVIAVYRQQAVAGAAPLACLDDNLAVDASELKLLAVGEPLARSPWAVAPSISPALARRIAIALTRLHADASGRAILAGARLSGIVPAQDADYAYARILTAEVLDEHY